VKEPPGLVVVNLLGRRSLNSCAASVRTGALATPIGRVLAVIYQLPSSWKPSAPLEQAIHEAVMPSPQDRGNEDGWEFFGNLAVRGFDIEAPERSVKTECGVLLYRRSGNKAYVRRHQASAHVIRNSTLTSTHPVFTRDVANNVWHLEQADLADQIIRRLGSLLAWSDETITVVRGRSVEAVPNRRLSLDSDLIGQAQKVDYDWATPQMRLDL